MNDLLATPYFFALQGSPTGIYSIPFFLIIICSVITGVSTLVAGAKLQSTYKRGWLLIASGVLRVVFVFPLGIFMLMLIPAGALELAAAIRLRKHVNGTAFLALAGILSMLFLPLMFVVPHQTSPFALFGGLLSIVGAFSLAFGLTLRASTRKAP